MKETPLSQLFEDWLQFYNFLSKNQDPATINPKTPELPGELPLNKGKKMAVDYRNSFNTYKALNKQLNRALDEMAESNLGDLDDYDKL